MTHSSSPARRRDGSRSRDERKQYPSLKKSLSASLSPSRPTEEAAAPPNSSSNGPSTPQRAVQSNPQLSVSIPNPPAAADAALAALHYLPTPLLVLSSLKTIVLANEAMGRLLGLDAFEPEHGSADNEKTEDEQSVLDRLVGRSLSEVGLQIIQAGQRVWVGWEVSKSSHWDASHWDASGLKSYLEISG